MNCVHLLTPGVKRARKSSDSLEEEEEEVMLMLPDVSTAYTTMEPNFAIIILDTKEIIAIWIVFLDNAWQSLDGNKYLSTYRNTYST